MLSSIAVVRKWQSESESRSVVSDSLQPHGLYSPWTSPGQNTGVGSRSLLQEIFPTQGSNPGLLHCRQILYQLSHQGSPINWQIPCKWPCADVRRAVWLGLIQMLPAWFLERLLELEFCFLFQRKPPCSTALNYHSFAFPAVPFSSWFCWLHAPSPPDQSVSSHWARSRQHEELIVLQLIKLCTRPHVLFSWS